MSGNLRPDDDEWSRISVESAVSAFTGAPFVTVRMGRESGRLTPEAARQLGTQFLDAAAGAENDAAAHWMLREMELPAEVAAGFILGLRAYRNEQGWNSSGHVDLVEPPDSPAGDAGDDSSTAGEAPLG